MAKKVSLIFLTLGLVLVTGGGYYLYLSERESYFIDRNFRLLALWSKKIGETANEYKDHFQYMISEFLENDYELTQCKKNSSSKDSTEECDYKNNSREKFKDKFENELSRNFEGKLISVSVCTKHERLEQNDFVNDQSRITAQLSSKDEDLLHLIYEKKKQESNQACQDTVEVDLSISEIIRHLITKQAFDDVVITEEVFSDVIIFDSKTGKVHFQANHSQKNHSIFRIDDFRDIIAQRPDTRGFFSFFSSNSNPTDVRNVKPDSSTPPALKDLLQSPTHRRITIGDISYELFTQPVVLPGLTLKEQTNYRHKSDIPARLILAGLVKTEKFQSEYRAIPHTWLLLFLLFVLLGLLSLPIIHLAFMYHHEPLRPIAVLSLLFTCVFGTALITLFFLDVVWLNNVRTKLDDQLKETAENIRDIFKDDLQKSLDRLREYDHSITFMRDFTCVTQDENCPFIYHHACAADDDCTSDGKLNDDKWVARKNYPVQCDNKNCDLFFWTDQNKKVRITWNTGSEYFLETSQVSLAHRDYVNRILEPESSLWHTEDPHQFYAQSLRSLGTGKHTVVLSIPSSRSESPESSKDKPQNWVAAIETEFKFLKSVAIPGDTGFAVIEDKVGRVLFHSDDKRSLWENFFEETDNNARLKAHAFSRTAGKFEGRYWGKGHSFYSTPLPGVPWSLVVFRNKELFRTTNFEALLLADTLFALYTVFSVIIPVLIWLFKKANRHKISISWFWPNPKRAYWCYTATTSVFFLLGILLFWCDMFPADCAVWFVFPYLLFSLVGSWLLTKVYPKRAQEICPKQLHRRHAFLVISCLLLFSALPMGIFFKAGADREMTLAMKYNLITLGQKLREAPDLDFSQIQSETPESSYKSSPTDECQENSSSENSALLQHSIHLSPIAKTRLCLYDNMQTEETSGHKDPSILERFHRRIRENSLSRLSNPVSIETLGLLWDQPPGKPFYWIDSPSHAFSLKFQAHSKSGTNWVVLRSWPSADVWSLPAFLDERPILGVFVLTACVPILLLVPIFIVSRIFPIVRKSSSNLKTENSNQETGNLLIIGLPQSLKSYLSEKSPFYDRWEKIDFLEFGDTLEKLKMTGKISYTDKDGILLDHFDYQFGVTEFDWAKLKLLADLLVKGKPIHVLSTINPFEFDFNDDPSQSSPDEPKGLAPTLLRQWSQVFQSFALYYTQGTSPDLKNARTGPDAVPHYEAIWQARTIDEKVTLYRLATDRFVHAENPDLHTLFGLGLIKSKPDPHWFDKDFEEYAENSDLSTLCKLGLIKSKPNPHWFDKDFEEYVLIAAQRDRLDAIERRMESRRQSQRHVWKWSIAIVLVVLVIGLLSTQQELHNVVVLVLSLLPVLLPTGSELIGSLKKMMALPPRTDRTSLGF